MLLDGYRQSRDLQPRDDVTAPSSPLQKGPRGGTFGESGGSDIPLGLLLGSFSSGVYGGFRLSLDEDFIPPVALMLLKVPEPRPGA